MPLILSFNDIESVNNVAAGCLGGRCEGQPGLRPEYHTHYYGAYFRDPDGNKFCVVCHEAVVEGDVSLDK